MLILSVQGSRATFDAMHSLTQLQLRAAVAAFHLAD